MLSIWVLYMYSSVFLYIMCSNIILLHFSQQCARLLWSALEEKPCVGIIYHVKMAICHYNLKPVLYIIPLLYCLFFSVFSLHRDIPIWPLTFYLRMLDSVQCIQLQCISFNIALLSAGISQDNLMRKVNYDIGTSIHMIVISLMVNKWSRKIKQTQGWGVVSDLTYVLT